MDSAYYTWIFFAAVGVNVGLFVKPGTVVRIGAVLFALDIIALLFSHDDATWTFGILAIAIPIITAATAAGAAIVGALRRRIRGAADG